jgi:hypothetical protein
MGITPRHFSNMNKKKALNVLVFDITTNAHAEDHNSGMGLWNVHRLHFLPTAPEERNKTQQRPMLQ